MVKYVNVNLMSIVTDLFYGSCTTNRRYYIYINLITVITVDRHGT